MRNLFILTCFLVLGIFVHGTEDGDPVPTLYDTPSLYDEEPFYVDFLVTAANHNVSDTSEHFVARITDPAAVNFARNEINKTEGWMIISGIIQNTTVDWNPNWSYHIQPDTVFFGDFLTEVCDASATYVEEHLDEAGGAFLPNYQWCPWGTRVIEELGSSSTPSPSTASPTTSTTTLRTNAPSQSPSFDDNGKDNGENGSGAHKVVIEHARWISIGLSLAILLR